jgi:HD-GYP domain-containing protein (c-di-GMP phosphodiesterase class II)
MRAVRDLLQSSQSRVPTKVDPSLLAWELADRAGADKELARDVRLATNFHDVAMAQIGLDIEKQDRPLSPVERQKLHEHPRHAARLLEDIQAMEAVSTIVLHHQVGERRGYPDGPRRDIPLGHASAIIDAHCS